jgi:pantoate--beta-alanine ligase
MKVIRQSKALKVLIAKANANGACIGFVPTMGSLHEGHFSLIRRAHGECGCVVVSIFVNPLQFAPGEDYSSYPRDFKADARLLQREGVDAVFFPTAETMYKKGFSTYVEETALSAFLCGVSRPGHFRGVCTVVAKLFHIVNPDIAYFGQKDYQQAQIIKRMVRDLDFSVKIRVLPIVREKDGLAMSSRNQHLTSRERIQARVLYEALRKVKKRVLEGERHAGTLKLSIKRILQGKEKITIDYVKIVDADTLQEKSILSGKVLIALAAYVGNTRLIDNVLCNVKK